jgi:hypothetical protein
MSRLIGALIGLLVFAGVAQADDEITGFRNLKWGMPVDEIRQLTRVLCIDYLGKFHCTCSRSAACDNMKLEVAGVSISVHMTVHKTYGLEAVQLEFNPDEFDTMRDAFVSKYGTFTESEDTVVSNRMGAQFTNTRLVWDKFESRGFASMNRYGKTLDMGYAMLMDREALSRWRAKEAAKKSRAKDDL